MCVRTSGSRSDTSKDWYFENATINSTVKLVQGLMKKYNVPLSRVVRHYDVVGKYCPNPFVLNDDPVTWSSFKSMVAGDKDLPPGYGKFQYIHKTVQTVHWRICVRIRNQCPVSGICEWAMAAVGDKL